MAFDAFLKIEGVAGETERLGHKGEIPIFSFSWGASNPTSIGGSTGGGGAGKVNISGFNFMKKTDSASAALFQACCTGKHFPKGFVTLYKAGGDKAVDFLKYEFEQVYIESIQWSGSSGGDDTPMESVSFAFGRVEMTYSPQAKDGTKVGKPVVGSWDLMQVTK
jgi:type VI secretion system secreted protein Hcp